MTIIAVVLGVTGCQSIEDTYKEWTGDGPIQYLNKVYNLTATSQWQSVKLDWHLIPDASRTAMLVECMTDEDTVTYTIGKDDSTFVVKDLLRDYDYEFLVSAIRVEDGVQTKKSLGDPIFAKPFSMESDEVKLFTHVVNKHIKVNDKKLFLTFELWSNNLDKFSIGYYEKGSSQETRLDYTREDNLVNNYPDGKPWALIGNDIDFTKPVTVYRTGEIETFGDMVLDLTPLELSFETPAVNSDFTIEVLPQMNNASEITYDNAKDVSNINLNYNLASLEDILYFPNLKTVNLGPNRYLQAGTENTVKSQFSSDAGYEISLGALEVAKKEMGVKINQYGHHYFDQTPSFFDGKNLTAQIPDISLENTSSWTVTKTPADMMTFGRDNIIVDDDTYWIPAVSPTLRVHVFTIEFGDTRSITGFKFKQAQVSNADINNTGDYYFWPAPTLQLPGSITVEVQDANNNWVAAASERTILVGDGAGETTLVWFNHAHSPIQAKRIRLTVSDSDFGKSYYNGVQTMFQRTAVGTFIPINN